MKTVIKYICMMLVSVGVISCSHKDSERSDQRSSQSETTQGDKIASHAQTRSWEESERQSSLIPKNGRPSLLDFTATWCGPCRRMKPIFEELETTYDEEMNFVSIDIDSHPELADQYGVQAVPTFIFLDDHGREIKRIQGAVEQNELENFINMLIDYDEKPLFDYDSK